MALFAVIATVDPAFTEAAIDLNFGDENYRVTDNVWVVFAPKMTAKNVSDKIGYVKERAARGVVLSTSAYWGLYSTSLWEWMKVKLENSDG